MGIALRRYPEYVDSSVPWLGKVPAHWQQLPGRACFTEEKAPNTGMKETTVLSLSYGRIVVKPPEKLHGLVPASFETYQIIEPYDIVIRPIDLQNDWVSLRTGLARTRGIITSAYMRLQTKAPLLSEYGHLLLHTYDLKKVFYGLGSGLRQNLSWRDFKYLPCLAPPSEEQAQIARFLDHTDRLTRRYIRAQRRLIELLTEQKQALIQQAVTRGLDPHVKLKPSGVEWLGEIPAHWEVRQIGHLAKLGNGSTPSRSNAAYWANGDYPWLNSSSVNQGTIAQADQFVTPLALRECHLPIVRPNSVLVAITGQGKTRGTAALLTVEATINQHIAFIAPQEEILSPEYLRLFLTGAYGQLRAISDGSGSTKGALTCADLKHFKAAIPPRSEQDMLVGAVGESVGRIDAGIGGTERQIDLIREYRTRLIADVVTGKLDVRQTAANLPEPEEEGSDYEDETPDDDDLDEQEVDDAE